MSLKTISFCIFFLFSIATLLFLGNWQVQRLAWKTDIIERIETEYARDPAQNELRLRTLQDAGRQDLPLVYGRATGRLDTHNIFLVSPKTLNNQIGAHVIIPLRLQSGGILFTNLGFTDVISVEKLELPNRIIEIDGIARKIDLNPMSSGNAPERNIWINPDIEQMAHARSYDLADVSPLMLYAQSASVTIKDVTFLDARWMPRNNHKQYAIFWFSMAAIFAVFFGYFIWKSNRHN